MNITSRLSRRDALNLLRQGSATALAARMLGFSTPASAQMGDPRRLVVLFPQHSILDKNWRQNLPHMASLSEQALSGVFSVFEKEKYRPLKDELIIVDGVYNNVGARGGAGDAHDWSTYSTLTGIAKADGGSAINKEGTEVQSLDLFLVKKLAINTAFKRPLFQIVKGQYGQTNIMNRGIISPGADNVSDPVRAFELLFAGAPTPPGPGTAPNLDQAARVLKVQKLYVERLRSELKAMNGVLDPANRKMVDKHLASMSDLEGFFQLNHDNAAGKPMGGSAVVCRQPTKPSAIDFQSMANIGMTSQLYFDVATAALACDRTRIVTLQYLNNTDNTTYLRHLPTAANQARALHDHVAHASGIGYGSAAHTSLNLEAYTWFMEMYAELLLRLKTAGVLEHTTVLFNIDMSGGNHTFTPPIPVIVAGGGGKKADGSRVLRSGRYLKYDRQPHTKLLLTLAHVMGATQFETFGTVTSASGEHGLLSEMLA